MFDHLTLTVKNLAVSREFYARALAPLGFTQQQDYGELLAFGPSGRAQFWLKEGPETQSPMHLAFRSADRAAVDGFHAAALDAGAHDDGAPGLRHHYHPNYYGAFVIDPDGHHIEAVCHLPIGAAAAKKKAAKGKAAGKKKPAARAKAKKRRA